ncbi:MAG: aminotransferase class I/II-fold pyridoxal phosphate-dependent enzyme [Cyclobacteriaceae bacterium]|nr:aminotransferase class I/II-fold pyridoxal phosphate-dependent enzyme [Cyclobacteriaceae bacterium]
MPHTITIKTADRIANVEEYYFSKKLAEVRGLDSADLRVINLGIGSPDLAPSASTIEALHRTAILPSSHGYQSYKGIPALREAIRDFCQRTYNVGLNAETEILPLMGSKEGIMHIAMAFVNEGDEVLIPDPGYPTYSSVAKLVGGRIRSYAMREDLNWGVDLDALRASDLSKIKVMWVNYPHMPTGRVASAAELKELVDLARKHQFLIVNDNPYSLILNDSPLSILSIEGASDVALELNSLSKSHNMAGWRIGWVAGKKEFVDAVLKVKSNMDSGMFLGLQQAAVEALKSDQEWFRQQNEVYVRRRQSAARILALLDCQVNPRQSGLFLWGRVPDSVTNVEKWIDEILYGTRVFLTPGFIFGENGKRYVRISLCATEAKMEEAALRLTKFLSQRKA